MALQTQSMDTAQGRDGVLTSSQLAAAGTGGGAHPAPPSRPQHRRASRPRKRESRAHQEDTAACLLPRSQPQHAQEGADAINHEDEAIVGAGGGGAEKLCRQGRVDGKVAAVAACVGKGAGGGDMTTAMTFDAAGENEG